MANRQKISKLEKLYEKYYFSLKDQVYWYIYRKIENNVIAEDITSDTFIKLFENITILEERDESGVKAWLLTVARNKVIDYFRSSRTRNTKQLEPEIFEIFTSEDMPYLDELMQDEKERGVIDAVNQLDNDEKELIYLRFKDDMPFDEIALIVGKSVGATKMKVYRALEKLKHIINGELL